MCQTADSQIARRKKLTTTVVGMETPAAVCHEDTEISFRSSYFWGHAHVGRRASLTLAVGHTVRNDGVGDVGATSLLGAVAQTIAEVGVAAKAAGVRRASGRWAAQVGLLVEHVLNAASLDDIFSTTCVTDREGEGED